MRDFKKFTSVEIRRYWEKNSPEMVQKIRHEFAGQKFKVWMDRFDDLHLYSRKVSYTKLNYINNNPVERGLCCAPEDYTYSSGCFYAGKPENKVPLVHLSDLL